VTRNKLSYLQLISFSVVRIYLRVKVSHRPNYASKLSNFMSELKGALESAPPAETWEITADDTSDYGPFGGEPTGDASIW
jgi:hypothetical protein